MTVGELRENMIVAFDTLRANKVRSSLTILGIVIGVTSVIAVAAIISGLNHYVSDKVQALGSRTYFVTRFPPGTFDFSRLPEHIRQRRYLQAADARAARELAPAAEFITPFGTRFAMPGIAGGGSNDVSYGGQRVEKVFVRGVEPDFIKAFPMFAIAEGRFISPMDEMHVRPVVVLGNAIADSLFARGDPVGKEVRLNGKLYEVIGVMKPESGLFGSPGPDDFALIPFSEFRKRYPESKEIALAFTVGEGYDVEDARDQMAQALRRVRRVPPGAPNDFEIISPDFISSMWNQLTGALVALTFLISSVGLVVGGVGVMNIMLISVTERTAEIGVRKAIGARRRDIRIQFLTEAIALCMVGGVLGVGLGFSIALLVRTLVPNVPASISLLWVGLGLAISMGTGLFFGYFPANRAANLDPIVCLRYE